MSVVAALITLGFWVAAIVVACKRVNRMRRTEDYRLGREYAVTILLLAAGWVVFWIGKTP